MKVYVLLCSLLFLSLTACTSDEDQIDENTVQEDHVERQLVEGEQFVYNLYLNEEYQDAEIIRQAKYFTKSEIITDLSTDWGRRYVYIPSDKFKKKDFVIIRTCKNGKNENCKGQKNTKIEFVLRTSTP